MFSALELFDVNLCAYVCVFVRMVRLSTRQEWNGMFQIVFIYHVPFEFFRPLFRPQSGSMRLSYDLSAAKCVICLKQVCFIVYIV